LQATSVSAIRFVGKSFASDPAASRTLLDQILREPHFSQYADREATWLAEQVIPIAKADPGFAAAIYAALYGQTITDASTSWFGGQPSRIMPLSSNRRQDYEHSRWQLGTAMDKFLRLSPHHATRALIDSRIGKEASEGYGGRDEPTIVNLGSTTIELRGYDIEFDAWDEDDDKEASGGRDDDILKHYVDFLRECDVPTYAASVAAASTDYATASVWTRIFGVGAERSGDVGNLLWPFIERPDFLENSDTLRDAVAFVASAWPTRSREARIRFETMALDETRFSEEEERVRWHRILGRILRLVPEDSLELKDMRALRRALDADGLLTENDPLRRFTSSWGEHEDYVRSELRRAGVDLDSGPNREVLDASDALYAQVQGTPSDSTATDLALLWSAAIALLTLVDANPGLHDKVDCSSWGNIGNAVERVASSANYAPGADGLPDLTSMFAVLQRLSGSRYPEPRENEA
jgi:hypothetical protein